MWLFTVSKNNWGLPNWFWVVLRLTCVALLPMTIAASTPVWNVMIIFLTLVNALGLVLDTSRAEKFGRENNEAGIDQS